MKSSFGFSASSNTFESQPISLTTTPGATRTRPMEITPVVGSISVSDLVSGPDPTLPCPQAGAATATASAAAQITGGTTFLIGELQLQQRLLPHRPGARTSRRVRCLVRRRQIFLARHTPGVDRVGPMRMTYRRTRRATLRPHNGPTDRYVRRGWCLPRRESSRRP